jgi:hypothetical protein
VGNGDGEEICLASVHGDPRGIFLSRGRGWKLKPDGEFPVAIPTRVARTMNQQKCMLLRWFGQSWPNFRFVPLCSRFKRNGNKRLNLHLMLANVIKYSMNY